MIVSRYRLYINDYIDDSRRSQGCLYLGDRDETPAFVSVKLLTHAQVFEKTWGMLFAQKPNVEIEMRVYGSEFARRFFRAYGNKRLRDSGGRANGDERRIPFQYVEDDDHQCGACSIDDRTFEERLRCLKGVLDRIGSKTCIPSRVLLRVLGNVEGAEDVVSRLRSCSDYMGILPVDYALQDICDPASNVSNPETFRISLVASSDEKDVKWSVLDPSENVIFKLDFDATEDDLLDPRQHADDGLLHYCWKFNEVDRLVDTIRAYVESHVLAPKLARICESVVGDGGTALDVRSISEIMGCCRVFPFAVLEASAEGVVEREVVLKLRGFGVAVGDLPQLDIQGAGDVRRSEESVECAMCPVVAYSFLPDRVGTVRCSLPRSEKGLGIPVGWWSDVFVVRIGETVELVSPEANDAPELHTELRIRNHNLTTGFRLSLNGEYDFSDGDGYCGAKDENRLEVFAENRYGGCDRPDDADAWSFEVEDDKGCVRAEETVADGRKVLSFEASQFCTIRIRVAWPGRNLAKSVVVRALGRAESIECEVRGDAGGPLPEPKIVKEANGNINVECFCSQSLTLHAKSVGSGDELWIAPIEIPELNIRSRGDDPIERSLSFRSAGCRIFTVRSRDEKSNLSYRISIVVKDDRSALARNVMCGAVTVACLHFFLLYGINWWMTLVYVVPVGAFYWYRKRECPRFGVLMRILLGADFVMFLWSMLQEVS